MKAIPSEEHLVGFCLTSCVVESQALSGSQQGSLRPASVPVLPPFPACLKVPSQQLVALYSVCVFKWQRSGEETYRFSYHPLVPTWCLLVVTSQSEALVPLLEVTSCTQGINVLYMFNDNTAI